MKQAIYGIWFWNLKFSGRIYIVLTDEDCVLYNLAHIVNCLSYYIFYKLINKDATLPQNLQLVPQLSPLKQKQKKM